MTCKMCMPVKHWISWNIRCMDMPLASIMVHLEKLMNNSNVKVIIRRCVITHKWYEEYGGNEGARVAKDLDGPDERELAVLVAVGHVHEVDDDEEEEEYAHVVDYYVHVPTHLLQPVHQSECAQELRQVLYYLWGLPHIS